MSIREKGVLTYIRRMKKAVAPLWIFTLLFLAAMFLPRLVTQGMFGDGLLYASMARNLAEGKGAVWAPWFSTGYWIDFASGAPYFENPPLMIWLQAGFFRLFGEGWWVEKLYSLFLFVLNAWLIVRVWETPLRGTVFQKKFGWLPLFFWYFIPSVIWGNPNNLMDNNLLTFCLLALWVGLDGVFSQRRLWLKLTLAGVFVYLGLMTKGPVALYPAAVPFLFALTTRPAAQSRRTKEWPRGIFQSLWIGIVAAGLFALMLVLIPESRMYFENYWHQRLGVVLSGVREDAALTGWARLSIFAILAKELAAVAVLSLILFFISRKRKITVGQSPSQHETDHLFLLFLLLGFAGTLPLMLSARQSGMYIIPSLPMFALAAGYFHLRVLHSWFSESGEKTARFLRRLKAWSVAGVFVLVAYLIFLFGQPGRERALLHALPHIQQAIPKGEKVGVCEKLMRDEHAHTYLQRFHHLELTRDLSVCRFVLTDRVCDEAMQEVLLENGFEKVMKESFSDGSYFVYAKR